MRRKSKRKFSPRSGATVGLKSLQYLRWLERIEESSIEKCELAVNLPTAKQRAIAEEKNEQEEKSILEETGENLSHANLSAAYESEKEIETLARNFQKQTARSSILLVGAAGVGKTAVFHEIVRQRSKLDLSEFEFWATSGARLIAGQTGFGMWQERVTKLSTKRKSKSDSASRKFIRTRRSRQKQRFDAGHRFVSQTENLARRIDGGRRMHTRTIPI